MFKKKRKWTSKRQQKKGLGTSEYMGRGEGGNTAYWKQHWPGGQEI